MEENKKSKKIVWIITAITVLILGIVGYIVYDNFLKVDKTVPNYDSNNTTASTTLTTTTTQKIINEENFTKYPEKNDESIISFELHELYTNDNVDLTKNFQNLKLKNGNIEYTLSCTEYNEECIRFEILINKVKLDDYSSEGAQDLKHIIVKEDYLLLQVYSNVSKCGYIKIFKNGDLIYTINNTTAEINLTGSSFDSIMKYNNNKLYYFIQLKETDKSYNVLKVIDFNEANINETEIERKEIKTDLGAICYDYSNED